MCYLHVICALEARVDDVASRALVIEDCRGFSRDYIIYALLLFSIAVCQVILTRATPFTDAEDEGSHYAL